MGSAAGLPSNIAGILARVVLPQAVTRDVVRSYIRKAICVGIWKSLKSESRALLLVASRVLRVVRSQVLRALLQGIFLEVELSTIRGRAFLFGLLTTLKDSFERVENILADLTKLLAIGIFYLSNPPVFRVYG